MEASGHIVGRLTELDSEHPCLASGSWSELQRITEQISFVSTLAAGFDGVYLFLPND